MVGLNSGLNSGKWLDFSIKSNYKMLLFTTREFLILFSLPVVTLAKEYTTLLASRECNLVLDSRTPVISIAGKTNVLSQLEQRRSRRELEGKPNPNLAPAKLHPQPGNSL